MQLCMVRFLITSLINEIIVLLPHHRIRTPVVLEAVVALIRMVMVGIVLGSN